MEKNIMYTGDHQLKEKNCVHKIMLKFICLKIIILKYVLFSKPLGEIITVQHCLP